MQTKSASRSPLGKGVPYTLAVVAAVCLLLTPSAILVLPILAVLFVGECMVRWQLRLVNNGQVVEAIIGEVRRAPWTTRTPAMAYYQYVTKDGRMINSRLQLSKMEVDQWYFGRRISVIYDPAKPTRHAHVEALWAVEWEAIGET
jgi:hypothetical protein